MTTETSETGPGLFLILLAECLVIGLCVYISYNSGFNHCASQPRPCDASGCVMAHIDRVLEATPADPEVDFSSLVSPRERYESASEQAY